MSAELLEKTLHTFQWVSRSLVALSLLGVALLLFATRESTALLIKVDQRTFFECLTDSAMVAAAITRAAVGLDHVKIVRFAKNTATEPSKENA